jgi:hypothetical protein
MAMKRAVKSSVSELDRAKLSVDDLTDAVRHLTLRMKMTETICQAIEVGRAADALKIAISEDEKLEPRTIERPAVEKSRTRIVPTPEDLNLQGSISESKIAENDKPDDDGEPSKSEPTENIIAASIAELYDRVGGFIKR